MRVARPRQVSDSKQYTQVLGFPFCSNHIPLGKGIYTGAGCTPETWWCNFFGEGHPCTTAQTNESIRITHRGMGDSNSHMTQKPTLAWVKTQNLPLELPASPVSSSPGRSLLSSRSCCLSDLGARSCDSGNSHDFLLLSGCQLG